MSLQKITKQKIIWYPWCNSRTENGHPLEIIKSQPSREYSAQWDTVYRPLVVLCESQHKVLTSGSCQSYTKFYYFFKFSVDIKTLINKLAHNLKENFTIDKEQTEPN